MDVMNDEIRAYIGISTQAELACDAVEAGAIRRYAQAIMDDDADYGPDAEATNRYGGPIAPPLFANHMTRRAFGTPDPVQERAHDPHFDGTAPQPGLPAITPLKGFAVLNGGADFEFLRYPRHGERVLSTLRYADIHEKKTSKGSMIVVVVEAEFRTAGGELLLRARRTSLRRPA